MRILFVCLGNICRSPMAEGILRQKAKEKGIAIEVDSAGTADYHVGECPDNRAVATAKKFGVDISSLKGRQFSRNDFKLFDRIYVMDNANLKNVMRLAATPEDREKVKLFLDLVADHSDKDVPDPWFGGPEGFIPVYNLLSKACDILLEEVEEISGKEN
jgi:protein-tyrosine phosphatase